MASLYGLANGLIIGFAETAAATLSFFASPPAGTAATLDFDEGANGALIADIRANILQYKVVLVNSVATLQKNGAAVTIAAPSALYSLQNTILNGVPDAALKSFIVALWNGTATSAQQQKALAYCLLKLHQAGVI